MLCAATVMALVASATAMPAMALVASALAFSPTAFPRGDKRAPALGFPRTRSSGPKMPTFADDVRKFKSLFGGKPDPNANADLIKELFDGKAFGAAIVPWYDRHLAFDFEGCFEGGKVTLSRDQYVQAMRELILSFPEFIYTCPQHDVAQDPSSCDVTWTAVVKGVHTGAPFSPMPGVAPVEATNKACQNDPEQIRALFNDEGQLTRLTVTALPGGQYSGPVGFFLQAGGDPAALPPPP